MLIPAGALVGLSFITCKDPYLGKLIFKILFLKWFLTLILNCRSRNTNLRNCNDW